MGTDETDGFVTLAEATREALAEVGPELFASPQRLIAFLLDSTDSKSPAMRMLSYNCDEEMIAPFVEVLKEQPRPIDCSEVTLENAARLLYDERVVAEDPARAATNDLAQGIALSHGMDMQDPSPLAQAICEAIDGRDAWTLLTTQLAEFLENVSSHIGRTPEVRVLEYNCDAAYLTLLFSAFSGSSDLPEKLSLAANRVAQILVNDRAISEATAFLAINQLAQGIASYLGTTLSQPLEPSYSTQGSSVTESTMSTSPSVTASFVQASSESEPAPHTEQVSRTPSAHSFSSSAAVPSASMGVPSASAGMGAPSAFAGVPSAPVGVPSASVGVPSAPAAIPSAPVGVPSASAAIPSASFASAGPSYSSAPSVSSVTPPPSAPSVSSVTPPTPADSSPVIYGTSANNGGHFTYQLLLDAKMPKTISLNGQVAVEETVGLSKVQLRVTNTSTSAVFITKAVAIGTYANSKKSFSVPYQTAPSTEFLAPTSSITMVFKAKLADLWTKTERHYEISGYAQPLDVTFLKSPEAHFSRPLTTLSVRIGESVISNSRLDLTITNIGKRSIHLKRVIAYAEGKSGDSWKVSSNNSQLIGALLPGKSKTLSFNSMVTQRWIAATRHYDITGYEE